MKFIDEGVIIKVNGFNTTKSGQYRYDVVCTNTSAVIFSGNCYMQSGTTSKDFNITDVVKSSNTLYGTYSVNLKVGDNTYTNNETVFHIYRYPNRKRRMETPFYENRYAIVPMLQGGSYGLVNNLELVPEYPVADITFDVKYMNNTGTQKKIKVGSNMTNITSTINTICTYSNSVSDMVDGTTGNPDSVYLCDGDGEIIKVAKLDWCPVSKYYLKWTDRYGSTQCQPFDKTETYSESIDKTEYTTYDLHRKVYNIDITPTWKINSSWIDQYLYPYYESIFVSETLELYDVEEGISYSVILKDSSYTEKTVKNQNRSLFNLELTLELDKKQNIVY